MTQNLIILIILLIGQFAIAQTSSILTFQNANVLAATTEIKNEVTKLKQGGFYEFVGFYSVEELAIIQENGNLLLTFNYHKLSQSNFIFYAQDVEYSNNEYYWFGEYIPESSSIAPSFIDISKNSENQYVFSMKLEGVSFRGLSLSDGSLGIFEYIGNPNACYTCIDKDTNFSEPIVIGPNNYANMKNCVENCPIDILFLYTAAAGKATSNIENQIWVAMKQTKSILKRSGVGSCKRDFNIVGIIPDFVFSHSNYITSRYPQGTVNRLSSQFTQAPILRTQYHADIVILIDDDYINTFHNLEQGYFGTDNLNPNLMYAILGVSNLDNSNYALAHQLGHLFTAQHSYNPHSNQPQGTYNGATFGNWPFRRSTNMYQDNTTFYIPYFSNQYLTYKTLFGLFTMGSANESTAFAFMNEACTVADMFTNPAPLPFAAFIDGDKFVCPCRNSSLSVTLRNAPIGPVSYEWFKSTDGINYTSNGTANSQFIQSSCIIGNIVYVKVRVTAGGQTIESFGMIKTRNSVGGLPCALKKEPTSVAEIKANDTYSIYPNPVTNTITVTSQSGFLINESIEVYNMEGKLVITQRVQDVGEIVSINLETIKNGNYYLIINQQNGKNTTIPFVKTK